MTMNRMMLIVSLLCCWFGIEAAVLTQQPLPELTLSYNTTNVQAMRFTLTLASTRSWIGFGISPNGDMPGSVAVIGIEGSAGVGVYDLNSRTLDGVVKRSNPLSSYGITSSSFVSSASGSVLSFTLDQSQPSAIQLVPGTHSLRQLSAASYVFAHGNTQTFAQHTERTSASYDLASSSSPAGPPSSPSPQNSVSTFDLILGFHAACGLLAFTVLLPIGASLALTHDRTSSDSSWFKKHWKIQAAGVFFALATLAIGVYFTESRRTLHFYLDHQKIGVAVVAAAVLQAINGFCRAHKPEGDTVSSKRQAWELLHRFVGAGTLVLGIANCILGPAALVGGNVNFLEFIPNYKPLQIVVYVLSGIAALIILISVIIRLARGRAAHEQLAIGK